EPATDTNKRLRVASPPQALQEFQALCGEVQGDGRVLELCKERVAELLEDARVAKPSKQELTRAATTGPQTLEQLGAELVRIVNIPANAGAARDIIAALRASRGAGQNEAHELARWILCRTRSGVHDGEPFSAEAQAAARAYIKASLG